MARCALAEWRPLPESSRQGRIVPTQLIYHSIVGSMEGAYGHFLNNSNLESHFLTGKGGRKVQVMDSEVRADANGAANVRAISVETEDDGDPDRDPWTPAQLKANVDIGVWALSTHPGIARRRIPAATLPGIGYHTMFGAPGPWTDVRGKTCPGVRRVRQFGEELLPAILAKLIGSPFQSQRPSIVVHPELHLGADVIRDIDVPTGPTGEGHAPVPGVRVERIVSVTPYGGHPEFFNGHTPNPRVGFCSPFKGGIDARVTVDQWLPNTIITVRVAYAD